MATVLGPMVTVTGDGATAGVLVAASNAPAVIKARADYVCNGQVSGGVGDEATINQALGVARTVYLSEGLYDVANPINVTVDGATLIGAGIGTGPTDTTYGGGTTIRVDGTTNTGLANAYVIQVHDDAANRPLARVRIAHLCVEGNSKAGTAVGGILFRGYNGRIEDVHTVNLSGDGIRFMGYSSTSWTTYNTMGVRCVAGWNGGYGIAFDDQESSDQHLIHCVANNNGQDGVYLGGASHQVAGLHAYANTGNGVRIGQYNSNSKLVNCKIENNTGGGLYVVSGAAGEQLGNCGFRGNQQSDIYFAGTGGVIVNGCRFDPHTDNGSAVTQYALNFAADAYVLVASNHAVSGWTSGAAVNYQTTHNNPVFGTNIGM